MRNSAKIPTILGLIVLIGGVVVGVVATQYRTIFRLGAQPDTAPQDVRITNATSDSISISWVTDKSTTGIVLWGPSTSLGQSSVGSDARSKQLHFVTLQNLTPSTTYYFKINSAGVTVDNGGSPWQFQTLTTDPNISSTKLVSGIVLNENGQPAVDAIIYLTADGTQSLSTQASESGNWVIPVPNVSDTSLFQIFVQGGSSGVATAQILAQASDPVPSITLGQTYDFRNNAKQQSNTLPEAQIDIIEGEETITPSRFGFLENEPSQSTVVTNSVTLESIDEGEIITTNDPEFFGEAPPGTKLDILIQSDPISDKVTVPSNGVWKWSPPKNLPGGKHTITISWTDASGILRKLTRSFVVSAEEGAAFESTPSATPIRTTTPRPSPSLIPSSSPTIIASASSSPRVSIPSTESGTPVAGSLTPTLLLSIMGVGLFSAAFFVSRKAT